MPPSLVLSYVHTHTGRYHVCEYVLLDVCVCEKTYRRPLPPLEKHGAGDLPGGGDGSGGGGGGSGCGVGFIGEEECNQGPETH